MQCLLCHSETSLVLASTFDCSVCGLRFKDPQTFLAIDAENERYRHHNNDSQDEGYRRFLNKLILPLTSFLPRNFISLDYGCGSGPTVSLLLNELGGDVYNYDPLFFADQSLLTKDKYDVVTSTEVVEHFRSPDKDWRVLIELVKPGGLLGIMTQFLKPETDYSGWWYKNDPTHVVFYREETFNFLARTYNLERVFSDDLSVVIFRKKVN